MSAYLSSFRAACGAGSAQGLYPDAATQTRLAFLLGLNLTVVAASFSIEEFLLPWQARMDRTTPGWCFVLAQASTIGVVAAIALRDKWCAVADALLAATLIGYAYMLAGNSGIDPRRAIQQAHLVFRAVELGLVVVIAMAGGVALRMLLRQRLSREDEVQDRTRRQFHVGELMALIAVFALGLGLINLFFNHFERETQLSEIALDVLRTLPATLPWLWGVTQPKLSGKALAAIVGITVGVMVLKVAVSYAWSGEELAVVTTQCGRRAAAYAAGATLNGMLLRGLGFRWRLGL